MLRLTIDNHRDSGLGAQGCIRLLITLSRKRRIQLFAMQGMLRLFGSDLTAVKDVFDSQPIDEEWYGVDETTGPFPEVQNEQ